MPFRVGEQREPHSIRDLLRWLDGLATQSIDLLERRLQVVDADVERHVAGALRRLADPAVDSTAVLAMDHGVLQRRIIDRPKRPAERLRIELPKSAGVAPQDLEMDDRVPCCVFHECSLRRHMRHPLSPSKNYAAQMRADRLLSILLLLQAHGRLSTTELAQRLEVSRRTVFRDLDAPRGAGRPVAS